MPRKKTQRLLDLRGNKWWFKRDIPAAVRAAFGGRTAYLVNLETGDIKVASRRRDELERETDQMFADARAGRLPAFAAHEDEVRRLAEAWAAELRASEQDPEGWHERTLRRPVQEDDFGRVEVFSPADLLEEEAESIARKHGSPASDRFLRFVHGHVDVDHYLESYLKEVRLARKTIAERRSLVKVFAAWAKSEGHGLADVLRKEAGRYVTENLVGKHRTTASKHLTAVSQYWEYLRVRGHVKGENPWTGQLLPDNKKRVERGDRDRNEREFTLEEMRALLFPPPPTKAKRKDWQLMQDVIRIGALSGMREAEIVTLWVGDIVFPTAKSATFDLQHGKGGNAARKVPVHPDLTDIIERRVKDRSTTDLLFPELKDKENPSDAFGKRFASYRKARNVNDKVPGQRRGRVNFHSFRRWFATEAERAGQPESIIAAVLGHAKGRQSITPSVYSGGPSDDQKRRCVEAVRLPAKEH